MNLILPTYQLIGIFWRTVHLIPHTYLTYIADEVSTSLATLSGHSGPINQVLLALPFALSASGCSVR